jgi:hypothetical protein
MTQQPDATPKVVAGSDQAAAEAPPPPSKQPNNPAHSAQPERKDEDLSSRAAELEAELAQVRSQARDTDTVRVRVEGEHSGLIHNGVYVGTEWTDVPAHVVPDMMEGAANSGVTLTQEETES